MRKTRVTLAYGKQGLEVEFPAERTTIIEPKYLAGVPDEPALLRQAMREPHASEPLRQRVPASARVGISVCDVTRATPTRPRPRGGESQARTPAFACGRGRRSAADRRAGFLARAREPDDSQAGA